MKIMKTILLVIALAFAIGAQAQADSFTVQEILNTQYAQQVLYAYNATDTTLVEYIGRADASAAQSDAAWQIQKISYDASDQVESITYADGTAAHSKKWSLRATYSY